MRFPDLPTRLVALRERFDVDYAELAQRLGCDKTTAWRRFQGSANLPEAKQQALVSGLCFLLAMKGVQLTEDDFRLNNTFEFFSRIGIPKLRAALLTGVSLPVPEALIDAALMSQEPLHAFVGHYHAHWRLADGSFARALVMVQKQPDGRVTFRLEWDGQGPFTVEGYLCMVGDELSVIGDRIAGNFRGSRSLFTMALDVDFDQRTKTVKGLQGFLQDRADGETILRRVVMVPAVLEEVGDGEVAVDADHVKARATARGMAFLNAGGRG